MTALLLTAGVTSAWGDGTVTWSADRNTATITPLVDGWIRETDKTNKNYTGADYEIKHTKYTKSEVETTQDFHAVLKFCIPAAAAGKKLNTVSLKLVTKKSAAKTSMAVYQLETDITTDATYSTLESAITTAKSKGTIGTFTIAQQVRSKQLGSDALGNYTFDLSAWTNNVTLNTVDITAGGNLNLFVSIAANQDYDTNENSVNKFFSSRATDITVTTDNGSTNVTAADLVPVLTVTYTNLENTEFVSPTYDRTCRTDNSAENGGDATIEIKNNSTFVGLMSFTMPEKKGYEVESATLRLVFERVKGGSGMEIYPYTTAFTESGRMGHSSTSDATRIATETEIGKAITAGTITTFTANGTNKALTSSNDVDKVSGDYADIGAWTNEIDLTDYVKNFTSGSSVGLMIAANSSSTDSKKIFSKEATASTIINTGMAAVDADAIKPQLIITYKKMDSYTLTVTTARAATLCLPFDATIPDGITAYTLNYTSGDKVTATEVTGGTLEANTPVLINAESATDYTFTRTGEITDGTSTSGALTGVYTATWCPASSYILGVKDNVVAFYHPEGANTNNVPAYRAYLTAEGAGARLSINFGDEETAISDIQAEQQVDGYYNLRGQRVENPTKGLYIVNGKKVIIK